MKLLRMIFLALIVSACSSPKADLQKWQKL